MKNSIIQRLRKLEEKTQDRLIILAIIDGTEKECSVDELAQSKNASFVKVLRGNRLKDVDIINFWVDSLAEQ